MRTDAGVTGELQVEAPPRVEEVSPSKNRTKTELGLVLLLSAAILIPCFWQRHIQAGDLASHVYNAWLAQLVEAGGAPRLFVVSAGEYLLFCFFLPYLLPTFVFFV